MSDRAAELRAVLTRASDVEGKRQAARQRDDAEAVAALENELRKLWARHADLEAQDA